MSESLFKQFMLFMYVVLLGILGWILFVDPNEWLQVIGLVVVGTPLYLWIVRFTCKVSREHGGFSPPTSNREPKA